MASRISSAEQETPPDRKIQPFLLHFVRMSSVRTGRKTGSSYSSLDLPIESEHHGGAADCFFHLWVRLTQIGTSPPTKNFFDDGPTQTLAISANEEEQ
jgi:hypothetical protein